MRSVPFDPDVIRKLATILTETGLTEIEIAEKDSRIRVARAPAPTVAYAPPLAASHTQGTTATASASAVAANDESGHPGAVLSPMVGVAYLAPEPGAPAYVSVGQTVSAGQTLLLIEAMKTFNQIKAPKDGTVRRILVSSGAPVEYGEVLMILD